MKRHPNTAEGSKTDRWALIAADVDGKTKKDCIQRYKGIVALIKKQREGK